MSSEWLIELPLSMSDFFIEEGFTQPNYFEDRRHSRLNCRCRGRLQFLSAPSVVERKESEMQVLVKDVSRCGIAILTHNQLWPEETFAVEFLGRRIEAVVCRCRRLGPRCYEAGGRILSFSADSAVD